MDVSPRSGQRHFLVTLEASQSLALSHPHVPITFNWIPGHQEIDSNEAADVLAKAALLLPVDAADQVLSKSRAFQLAHNIVRSRWHQVRLS